MDKLIETYQNHLSGFIISVPTLFNWMKFASLYYASRRAFLKVINKQKKYNYRPAEEYINKLQIIKKLY